MLEPGSVGSTGSLDRQFVFIVGAPRSGTTWLHQMLAEHPAVAALPEEMTLFSKYLAPAAHAYAEESERLRNGAWRQGLPLLVDEEEFRQALLLVVERVYARVVARKPGAEVVLDKHPHYAAHLPFISHLLPDCKVIHIIRDGRDVAVSTMRTKRLVGHGQGTIEGAAQVWVNRVRQAQRFGEEAGSHRYLEMRYEDLLADTRDGVARVLAFIGTSEAPGYLDHVVDAFHVEKRMVSRGDRDLNALRGVSGAIWERKLVLHERFLFDRLAGSLLSELGYAREGWWKLRWSDGLRLQLWLLRQRVALLRAGIASAIRYPHR